MIRSVNIKKWFRKNWRLVLILFIALVLRFINLSSNPPSLTPDEAALGYNAYSILKTGRDEWGKLLPIIFKSFGDYKPGLYIYSSVPFVLLFGLNEFSIRASSALAGVLAVYLVFEITKRLFKYESFKLKGFKIEEIAAFFLAISPWHIQFSRGAWEVNLSLTLTLAGILFFLKAFKNQKNLILSALFFALTLVCYQGAKASTLVVLFVLAVSFFGEVKKLLKNKKTLFISLFVGLLVSLPIILSMFDGKTGRLTVFSVFSYKRPEEYLQNFLNQGGEKIGSLSYFLFHSETYNFLRGILGRWFNHFSTKFLFFVGDWPNPRQSVPNNGMQTVFDLVFFIAGLVGITKIKDKKTFKFLTLWLILSPLPSALSRDQVHAVRSLNMVVPLVFILSLGFIEVVKCIKNIKINFVKILGTFLFVMAFLASYIYFLDALFVHQPKHNSKYWEYGYKQIVETITPIQKNYKTIRVQQSFAQPYIYFLFYQKYDPRKFQKNAVWVPSEYKYDVGYVEKLDNIQFGPIDWSVNRGDSGTLFVADPIRIPPEDSSDQNLFNVIREIYYLNGRDLAFRIIEVR